jgi:hypothetical protein
MSLKIQSNRHEEDCAAPGATSFVSQIHKGKLAAGLLLACVAALLTMACGGSSSSSSSKPASGTGALYTFITDTPSCNVLGFSIFPSEMDLHPSGQPPTSLVTVWPTNISLTSPAIEMTTLRDTMVVANLTSMPSGTYDQLMLRVVLNGASTFDSTQNPPVSKYAPRAVGDSVTINLQPPLVITSGKTSAIELDLNLPQTLGVDSQGQLNGTINWAFTARSLVASSSTGFGEMDDLHGFVRSVTPSIPGSTFTGSFLLQTLPETSTSSSGGGPALNVYLNDTTTLCVAEACNVPVSQLDQVPTGSYVEVDGNVNENGNLVANTIQIEDREFVSQQLLGYLGPVLDVTKDANGNVTQFDMLVRETVPSNQTAIPILSTVTVNISSSTTFNPYLVSSDLASLASSGNLALDASTLAPGQEVVVNGVYSKPASGPITVEANSIYPRQESVQGTFSSLVGTPGSDNKTGAFQMAPCAGIMGNSPFMVVTDAQTNFINTSGLNTLSATSPLMVRGLVFLNLQNTTIQGTGTAVPAGTMVLLASQVHQF